MRTTFGDHSPRTQAVSKYSYVLMAVMFFMIIGALWYIIGITKYHTVLKNSSTAIGTQLQFPRSQANVNIKNIYTDDQKNVLIVQLAVPDESSTMLPSKGTSYTVYVGSKSLTESHQKQITTLFGRMSTSGDMILILPNPQKEVYSFFIMNNQYLGFDSNTADTVDDGQDSSDSSSDDADVDAGEDNDDTDTTSSGKMTPEQQKNAAAYQMANAMNNYNYQDAVNESGTNQANGNNAYAIKSNTQDVISFRVTAYPAIHTSAYEPKVIHSNLITKDGEFDFKTFYDKVYKQSAINHLKQQNSQLQDQLNQIKTVKSELSSRLEANPQDAQAQTRMSQVKSSESSLSEQQLDLQAKIKKYSHNNYDSSLFANLQTKARVLQNLKNN